METFTGPDDPRYLALLDAEMEHRAEQSRRDLIWGAHVGQVLENLWIGDRYIAGDPEWLEQHNIEVVVNCTAELPRGPRTPPELHLPLEDGEAPAQLTALLRGLAQRLGEYKHKNILIHCSAGVSRSATVVLTYLMLVQGLTYSAALRFLQTRWPQANPDRVYRKHLEQL